MHWRVAAYVTGLYHGRGTADFVEDFIELWPDYSSEAEEVLKHLSRVEEFLKQLEQLEDEL